MGQKTDTLALAQSPLFFFEEPAARSVLMSRSLLFLNTLCEGDVGAWSEGTVIKLLFERVVLPGRGAVPKLLFRVWDRGVDGASVAGRVIVVRSTSSVIDIVCRTSRYPA